SLPALSSFLLEFCPKLYRFLFIFMDFYEKQNVLFRAAHIPVKQKNISCTLMSDAKDVFFHLNFRIF
ncbi:hypothetical protein, partial [Suipraeoptans intestinalis]|uniref:hypothetical protein n=1 Tax=Suipraeoptans intestinalis TaxID=2606628 RepID=UPI0019D62684